MATPFANSFRAPPKNDEFITTRIQENQGGTPMEFLSSDILGLNFKVVRYFEGNTEREVERHFMKAFFSSMASNSRQTTDINSSSLPMRQRKLPASFWRQDVGNPSGPDMVNDNNVFHPCQTQNMLIDTQYNRNNQSSYIKNPTIGQFHANITGTTIGQSHANITGTTIGQFQGVQTQCRSSNAPLLDYPPAVSSHLVSYSKLPMSIMSAPNVTITHAQMDVRPICSISDASAVNYARGPTTGHGFNPRYNSLLVQPEVMLQLPLVHGQQRAAGTKKG